MHSETRDAALRKFEFSLLEQTGYAPLLSHEWQTGNAIDAAQRYRYIIPEGPEPVGAGQGLTVSGTTLLELCHQRYNDLSHMKEARDLARALLHYQLNGRELLSRSLFTSLQKLQVSGND